MNEEIKINPIFADALFPLEAEQLAQLEASLLKNGLEVGLMTWNGFLIDGHNRWNVITKHELPYFTIKRDVDFQDEEEVLEWMDINQYGRRSGNANQRTLLLARIYDRAKKQIGAPEGNQNWQKDKGTQSVPLSFEDDADEDIQDLTVEYEEGYKPKSQKTSEKVGKQFGVSSTKVKQSAKVSAAFKVVDAETKAKFQRGEISQKALLALANKIKSDALLGKVADSFDKKKEETPIDPRFNDFTAEAKHHGNIIFNRLKGFREAIEKAQTFFKLNNVEFQEFGKHLSQTFKMFEDFTLEARILKRLVVCSYCRAKGCDLCTNGYVFDSTDKANTDLIEYRKANNG